MNNLQIINLIIMAGATVMVCCAGACLYFLRRARNEGQNFMALATQLEGELADTSRDLDTITQRATDQARRIAWLESRVRNNSPVAPAPAEEAPAAVSAKPTITERRHRVLQLTRRGMDCNSIASMLNMPHGEVELMVSLSHVN